ncbi:hypothetical protein M404DRAFT_337383 [Pisolithus tinctorius Marx 270]|uniref:Uncharacterized protein n=1 Tax=Pisolithus tinctorius Marx 270 TaxID=870435 RepID=A0A0C3NHN6_PISTI|nr:hypothetical protein M404DRAFT_337383 [Pisolithus tinctorius Marx 270]
MIQTPPKHYGIELPRHEVPVTRIPGSNKLLRLNGLWGPKDIPSRSFGTICWVEVTGRHAARATKTSRSRSCSYFKVCVAWKLPPLHRNLLRCRYSLIFRRFQQTLTLAGTGGTFEDKWAHSLDRPTIQPRGWISVFEGSI